MAVDEPRLGFDEFEFQAETGELWRRGERVKLQPQPARLLAALLAAPGRVVRREALYEALWPERVVEYDQALNFAVARLRRALGDDASSPRWIETVPHVGYRFIGRVEAGRPRPSRRSRAGAVVAGAAVVAVVLVAVARSFGASVGEGRTSPPRVVVLPLEWAGEGRDPATLLTLHHDLITTLATLDPARLEVLAPETARRIGAGGEAPAAELLRSLGVDWLLAGSVEPRPGGELALRARLVAADDGRVAWSDRFVREPPALSALPAATARGVARAVGLRPPDGGGPAPEPAAGDALPAEADRALRVARWLMAQGGSEPMARAREALERAGGASPEAVAVHAALAEWHALRGGWDSARIHGARAVALDERDPRGHRQLARALIETWDVEGAGRHYRRAVDLAPGVALYRAILPAYLGASGRLDAAVHHLERAVELDPLAPAVHRDLGSMFVFHGAPERAIPVCRRQLDLEPGGAGGIACLLRAFSAAGPADSAAAYAVRLMEAEGASAEARAAVRGAGVAGGRGPAPDAVLARYRRWWAARLDALDRAGEVHPYFVARARAVAGDADGAFRALERALEADGMWPLYARSEPQLASLRGDPRFARWLARLDARVAQAEAAGRAKAPRVEAPPPLP